MVHVLAMSFMMQKKMKIHFHYAQNRKGEKETFFREIINRSHSCHFSLLRHIYTVVRLFREEVSSSPSPKFKPA